MVRRIFNILTVAALLFFAVLLAFAVPSFFDPQFEVNNRSTEPVSVVAEWRNEAMQIGDMGPMSSFVFSVDAEAAIRFRVHYPGGREVESEPIYFTRGTKVIATITDGGVEVRYDFET